MDVNVYVSKSCPWYRKVEELLDGLGIKYTAMDISGDREAAMELVKKTKTMAVPVTKIGEKYIVGYQPDEIKAALGISG